LRLTFCPIIVHYERRQNTWLIAEYKSEILYNLSYSTYKSPLKDIRVQYIVFGASCSMSDEPFNNSDKVIIDTEIQPKA
jgi:hypothetical protein